jgi:hypothetical protein
MTELKKKILIITIPIVVGILLIVSVFYNIKQYREDQANKQALLSQVTEMKQLLDGVARAQSAYASKEDLENFAKRNKVDLDTIKNDLETLNADVKGIGQLVVTSQEQRYSNIPSSTTRPNPNPQPIPCENGVCPDPYGYLANTQTLRVNELFSGKQIPVGDVSFESWKDKPWSVHIFPRNYYVTTVLGQDEDGKHYMYHKFEVEVNGKRQSVNIKKSEFLEEMPESKFHWWNPRVGIGMQGGIAFATSPAMCGLEECSIVSGSTVPYLSFSPFSYGQTKLKNDWIFARVGAGYDIVNKTGHFSIAPAMWNIGEVVPFVNNTYVGPTVGVDTDANVSVNIGLSTDF